MKKIQTGIFQHTTVGRMSNNNKIFSSIFFYFFVVCGVVWCGCHIIAQAGFFYTTHIYIPRRNVWFSNV